MTIWSFTTSFVRVLFSLTLLVPSTHPLFNLPYWCFPPILYLLYRNRMDVFTPFYVGRSGVVASPVSQLTRHLSVMRRLSFLLLLMITLFKQKISELWSRITRRSSRFSHDNLKTSDPNDPEVIVKIDISNAFNTSCRVLTLDVLSGRVSRDYGCDLKRGDTIVTSETLSN